MLMYAVPLCFVVLVLVLVVWWYYQFFRFNAYLKHFPRVKQYPVIGCALEFSSTTVLNTRCLELEKKLGPIFWAMAGFEPHLMVADTKLIEIVVNSPACLGKTRFYRYLRKWLGLGLVTSSGDRWKMHRKLITPAFHIKILEQFTDTFNSAGDILVEKLTKELKNDSTDIFPYISLCALDIICETAMGTSINAQEQGYSEYAHNVNEVCRIVVERLIRPFEHVDVTYQFTENYRQEKGVIKALHDFTDTVIRRRRTELGKRTVTEVRTEEDGRKKKMNFLDLLLVYSENEKVFLDQDIREEVDTFMFGGHDTVSTALGFTLYLLANNAPEQVKAFAEIKSLFEDDRDRAITFQDLRAMKYLESVIKESMRLYTPFPFFLRKLSADLEYEGKILPKGLSLVIMASIVHRNPKFYKDPELFDPERFLSQKAQTRDAYSYMPFSAGPRNCIGQKYAMLVMKSVLAKVLRNFELLPVKYELKIAVEMVMKAKNGIRVGLKKREW